LRVRITRTPKETEIEGVSLRGLFPGVVRDVSPVLGSWLIAEEYAESEMRQLTPIDDQLDESFTAARRTPRERRSRKR
jgi:hypothetical protein